MKDATVSCEHSTKIGKVCSHAVTAEQLDAWGFPVERTEKVVGSTTIVRPGMKSHKAIHAAWIAGHIRICTLDPREIGRGHTH